MQNKASGGSCKERTIRLRELTWIQCRLPLNLPEFDAPGEMLDGRRESCPALGTEENYLVHEY